MSDLLDAQLLPEDQVFPELHVRQTTLSVCKKKNRCRADAGLSPIFHLRYFYGTAHKYPVLLKHVLLDHPARAGVDFQLSLSSAVLLFPAQFPPQNG